MTQDNDVQQGIHIFVHEILLWEFGEKVSEDPYFAQISDEIMNVFINDSQTKLQFTTLFSQIRMAARDTGV